MAKNQNKQKLSATNDQKDSEAYHIPVLFQEVLQGLTINPEGIYVDCTFGGGGHTKGILEKLSDKGRLFAFDQDDDAKANLPQEDRIAFVPQNFRHIKRFLRLQGITKVDGIMADLGVSSHQFDEAERGFSTRFNAPLDMRMDRRQQKMAFDIVQQYNEQQLHKMFEQYGEVTNAKTLAKKIVSSRNAVSLKTIDAFKTALHDIVKGNPHKYFAQVFQALRIELNEEMEALKEMLEQAKELLNPGGRIAVITFHSIEDRIVKNFFRQGSFDEEIENPFINSIKESELVVITKKPITANEEELKKNPRARSAKLRIAEKRR